MVYPVRHSYSEANRDLIVRAYLDCLKNLLDQIDSGALGQVVSALNDARVRGASVYILGNGGSAATASHLANDLGKATKKHGRGAVRVVSLADNSAWITALANDEGYSRAFSGQLDSLLRSGDIVIGISASGNSENMLVAMELAKARGATTIGLLGFDGGALLKMVDMSIHIATESGYYGPVEDVHLALGHLITLCLS